MRYVPIMMSFVFLTWTASVGAETCEHTANAFKCVKFEKNYDGDTLTVSIPNVHPLLGQKVSVRILGIDTPEVKTHDTCEKSAARNAQRLVENLLSHAQRIDLENVARDKYFRILADVRVDGKSVAELLIKNRLAVAYDGGTKAKTNWCLLAEGRSKPKN